MKQKQQEVRVGDSVHLRRESGKVKEWAKNVASGSGVWGGLTNSCEKKRSERQRRKGKINPFEYRVPNSKVR